MDEEEKVSTVRRLVAMQQTLRTLAESLESAAGACNEGDAKGLAFALYMLKESIGVYSKEVSRWTVRYIQSD